MRSALKKPIPQVSQKYINKRLSFYLTALKKKPDIIELDKDEYLVVASTYEMIKNKYARGINKGQYSSVKLKIYNNFFTVHLVAVDGKPTMMAFSDTWDFSIRKGE